MNKINIIGAYITEDTNFTPKGVHLRWNLSKNIDPSGDYSFKIFRRKSLSEDISALKGFLEKKDSLGEIDISLVDIIEEGSKILLQFKEPLVYLKFSISSPNQLIDYRRGRSPYSHHIRPKIQQNASMKVYNKNIEVATVHESHTLIVNNIQFDAVLLDLNNSVINDVEFLTVAKYCSSKDWFSLKNGLKKVNNKNEIGKRLDGVKNRYTLNNSSYDKKFDSLMHAQNYPSTSNINIKLESTIDNFRKIIHIAATDPNMARILGLYYVDSTANPNECYDYKVVETKTKDCGLLLNINGITEDLEAPLLVKTQQTKGFTWNGKEPLAKVDLFWKPIVWRRNKIQPLYYDLKRDEKLITSDAPIPSYMQKDRDDNALKHLFIDEPLEMGSHSYQTRSIDIFGRVSNYVKQEQGEIILEDLLSPPPPTRLKASVTKKDDNYLGIFSFEYGYNQRKIAPDTKSIQLYWKENSLSSHENEDSWMKFSEDIELNELSSRILTSLSDVEIELKNMYKNPEYGNYELCTDLDILEPDIFKGFKIGNNIINYSTPGVYSEESLHLSVHLGVNAINNLNVGESYSLVDNNDDNKIQVLECNRVIEFDVLGGEIAFEFYDNGEIPENRAVIARVVGYQKSTNNLLIRLSKENLAKLKDASGVTCTHYAPYMITEQKIDIVSSEIEHKPNQPYWINSSETSVLKAYIAMSATDYRDNESVLSLPVEVSTIKPANFPELKAPKPAIIDQNKGWATPPDLEGKSLVKLGWQMEGLELNSYRLEVARVLDTTLIISAKKNWLNGEDLKGPMMPAVPKYSINITNFETLASGSLKVKYFHIDASLPALDFKAYKNGRVKMALPTQETDECMKPVLQRKFITFKIVNASDSSTLILSPANGKSDEISIGESEIELQPNFNNLAKIDSFLALLANGSSNDEAFSIVSKVPVPIENGGVEFIDEIPGIGSNRFFYKVRLVDVADNRSEWSPCSMPIYQLDTTPPEAVKNLEVSTLKNNSRLLSWDVSDEKGLYGYIINGIEIEKEELSYKQQSTPLEQILFSKNIDIEMTDENDLMNTLDSLKLFITDIHKPEESLSPAYDYIYDIDEDGNTLHIKGISFYEEQRGNFIVMLTTKTGDRYSTEGFNRNRLAISINNSDNKIEIYVIKKINYNDKPILIKSKKVEV